jgi:hypothetical protein
MITSCGAGVGILAEEIRDAADWPALGPVWAKPVARRNALVQPRPAATRAGNASVCGSERPSPRLTPSPITHTRPVLGNESSGVAFDALAFDWSRLAAEADALTSRLLFVRISAALVRGVKAAHPLARMHPAAAAAILEATLAARPGRRTLMPRVHVDAQ